MDYPTRDTSLIGAAGVHFVVSELSLRGLIALPTIRNTAGVDVIVSNNRGSWRANLQVKTSRSKVTFWPVGKKYAEWISERNYYVFLRYDAKKNGFDVFIETSQQVADCVRLSQEDEMRKGIKPWAPCFNPKGELDSLREKWAKFGLDVS